MMVAIWFVVGLVALFGALVESSIVNGCFSHLMPSFRSTHKLGSEPSVLDALSCRDLCKGRNGCDYFVYGASANKTDCELYTWRHDNATGGIVDFLNWSNAKSAQAGSRPFCLVCPARGSLSYSCSSRSETYPKAVVGPPSCEERSIYFGLSAKELHGCHVESYLVDVDDKMTHGRRLNGGDDDDDDDAGKNDNNNNEAKSVATSDDDDDDDDDDDSLDHQGVHVSKRGPSKDVVHVSRGKSRNRRSSNSNKSTPCKLRQRTKACSKNGDCHKDCHKNDNCDCHKNDKCDCHKDDCDCHDSHKTKITITVN